MLKTWNVEKVGKLKCWKSTLKVAVESWTWYVFKRKLKCWKVEMLKGWKIEKLEAGKLQSWNVEKLNTYMTSLRVTKRLLGGGLVALVEVDRYVWHFHIFNIYNTLNFSTIFQFSMFQHFNFPTCWNVEMFKIEISNIFNIVIFQLLSIFNIFNISTFNISTFQHCQGWSRDLHLIGKVEMLKVGMLKMLKGWKLKMMKCWKLKCWTVIWVSFEHRCIFQHFNIFNIYNFSTLQHVQHFNFPTFQHF